jgi:hypothetical protein
MFCNVSHIVTLTFYDTARCVMTLRFVMCTLDIVLRYVAENVNSFG